MRSLIDNSKLVYPDQWVLSLVAKPRGSNPEHAFIIVEALLDNGQRFCYRRYDFVVKEVPNVPIKKGEGLVVIKDEPKTSADYSDEERSRYFWSMIMKVEALNEGCRGASWIISPAEAKALHDAIVVDQGAPPAYQFLGEFSMFAASSSQSGHNCYTWARAKVLSLPTNQNIQHDDRLKPSFGDFVGSRTTLHLNLPVSQEPVSLNCRII